MKLLLVIEILLFGVLYIYSCKKYLDDIALLDAMEYRMKLLLPIGFHILKIFRHQYSTMYEKRLEMKFRELKGEKHAHYFLRVFMAQKILNLMLAIIFVTFIGTQTVADITYLIFSLALLGALFFLTDKQLDDLVKKRRKGIQLEFPEFLNKLILLVNAGLTIPGALNKIARDPDKNSPLYFELFMMLNEIDSGISHVQAYERFAKRCRLQEVTMFVASLLQNLKKGNDVLIPVLRLQANTCWENRKNIARKSGEEAASKLILPMTIMFVAILAMLMTPAIFQISF